jgi:hypothetical protein
MMLRTVTYFVGADLGQVQDPSAFAVLEHLVEVDQSRRDGVTFEFPQQVTLSLRHLERPPLGTPYPVQVDRLRAICAKLRERANVAGVSCVVDATGVGRPVVDLMRRDGLAGASIMPVMITGGSAAPRFEGGSWHVCKRDLVTALQLSLYSGEVGVADRLPLSDLLMSELQNFRLKITAAGNDTYEAWRSGQHDDLVLALALPVWASRERRTVGEVARRLL